MIIGNYDVTLRGIKNLDQKKPQKADLVKRITQTQLTRSNQDIKKWRTALINAEAVIRPTRTDLIRVYKEITLDAHLFSVMQQRKNKVLARGFKLVDKEGEVNDEATAILKTDWLHKFINYTLDAVFYGYSLVEFGPIVDDEFTKLQLVPREYVIPDNQTFTTTLGGEGLPFNVPPFNAWTIFIGDPKDLGLLNKAAPLVLWKRLVMAVWAEYNELYGVPLRVGKTESRDPDVRQNLEDMLTNLGASAWGLFDKEDEIEIVSGIKVGGQGTYRDFIKMADAQLSKLIVGQTMTTEDGASRSQAEVHASILESFTGNDLTAVAYCINNKLLPFMASHGFSVEGLKFTWDLSEKLSITDQFTIDQKLLDYYNLPAEYITATYGTPVEDKPDLPGGVFSVMPGVKNLYKDFTE